MKCETLYVERNTLVSKIVKQLSATLSSYMPTTLKDLTWKEEKPKVMLCPCNASSPVSHGEYEVAIIDDYASTY